MMATIGGKYGQNPPAGGRRSIQIPANLRVPRQMTGDTLGLNPVMSNFLKRVMMALSYGPSMRVGC